MIFDLAVDPGERRPGMGYQSWFYDRMFLMGGAQKSAKEMLATFKEFPPRQKPGSFTVSDVSAMLDRARANNPVTNFRAVRRPVFFALPST